MIMSDTGLRKPVNLVGECSGVESIIGNGIFPIGLCVSSTGSSMVSKWNYIGGSDWNCLGRSDWLKKWR